MKKHTKEEVYQIRKGNFVVVARTECYEDWDVIKDALRAANRGEEHGYIEHLLDRGMFWGRVAGRPLHASPCQKGISRRSEGAPCRRIIP
jgi:hypothetical protein